MQVKKIYSMRWATPDNSFVGLIADTDEGDGLSIGTPYDETSIIWEDVKAFPVADIAAYVAPEESQQ